MAIPNTVPHTQFEEVSGEWSEGIYNYIFKGSPEKGLRAVPTTISILFLGGFGGSSQYTVSAAVAMLQVICHVRNMNLRGRRA